MTLSSSEAPAGEQLEIGPRQRRRRPPWRRLRRAVLAGLGTSLVLLSGTLASAHGWRPPSTQPPLRAEPSPAVAPADRHLPYAFVDAFDTVTDSGLRARIVRPRGAEGTIPGVVLVAGSGATTRDDLAPEAEALARGGLAVLTYDKRTEGYSPLSRDYGRLAEDALAGLTTVGRQPGVDPDRVGLLGFSEGGWVVPIAAGRAPDRVAFTVLVSAPIVSPLEQAAWAADRALAEAPDPLRAAVATGLVMGRPVVDYLRTDIGPTLSAGRQPTYAVWGAADPSVPVAVANQRLRAATGERSVVEVVPGSGHRVAIASGWAERVSDWVRRGYPRDAVVRGVEPDTLAGLPTLPVLGTLGDPRLQLGLSLAAASVAGVWPVRRRPAGVRSVRSG